MLRRAASKVPPLFARGLRVSANRGGPSQSSSLKDKAGAALFVGALGGLTVLGTWQVQRRQWKIGLVEEREARVDIPAVPLHTLPDAEEELKHRQVSVQGTFDFSRQVFVGPRACPDKDCDPVTSHKTGYFVVTPLTTPDNTEILVNRGWVPRSRAESGTFAEPTAGPVEVRGWVTTGEKRNKYLTDWKPTGDKSEWIVLDAQEVQKHLVVKDPAVRSGAVVLEAGEVPGGRADFIRKKRDQYVEFYTTPDTHLLYAATWYTLAACIAGGVFVRYRRRTKLLKGR